MTLQIECKGGRLSFHLAQLRCADLCLLLFFFPLLATHQKTWENKNGTVNAPLNHITSFHIVLLHTQRLRNIKLPQLKMSHL